MDKRIPIFVPVIAQNVFCNEFEAGGKQKRTSMGNEWVLLLRNECNFIPKHPKLSVANFPVNIGKSPQIQCLADVQNDLYRYAGHKGFRPISSLKCGVTKLVVLK